jgi:hypothetical protein
VADQTYPVPVIRRLRVYAFDPQSSTSIASAGFNVATIQLPWEQWNEAALEPGPINEYLEIIDVDPVSGQFYEPVDLNHPSVLARDGLDPSEGDPRFHQQMVFAVAMKTIRSFERALGRRVFWSGRWDQKKRKYISVSRLRVYPHGLREANAYYSRDKKALLFGYFPSATKDSSASWVFTALSHDIIAHETTHAILDGLHRRYAEATSVDSLAFHEAFSDIVALLSHFTLGEALQAHIQREGGNLEVRGLMSGLARQFGNARGMKGPLREAINSRLDEDETNITLLASTTKPHDRGAILVAAIFDAFLTIYKQRTADLMRIGNVGVNAADRRDLSPDLATRLAREAAKSADHVLRMCIRALDYLPPVDVRFGEFLRAIITADTDLIPNDPYHYRLAIIEAFRRRGILPEGTLSLAPDSLCWEPPESDLALDAKLEPLDLDWHPAREKAEDIAEINRALMHRWLIEDEDQESDSDWQKACGVVFRDDLLPPEWNTELKSVLRWPPDPLNPGTRSRAKVEVHSVRTTRRTGPDGQELYQLIVEVTQRRRGFLSAERQRAAEVANQADREDFLFRGGATLIFDLRRKKLKYAIRKSIASSARLEEQRMFLEANPQFRLRSHYDDDSLGSVAMDEPFAFAHRGY